MLAKEVDPEVEEELGYDGQAHAEVKQFSQHDLEGQAAFVVQQMTPILGRHALKVRPSDSCPFHPSGSRLTVYTAKSTCSLTGAACGKARLETGLRMFLLWCKIAVKRELC